MDIKLIDRKTNDGIKLDILGLSQSSGRKKPSPPRYRKPKEEESYLDYAKYYSKRYVEYLDKLYRWESYREDLENEFQMELPLSSLDILKTMMGRTFIFFIKDGSSGYRFDAICLGYEKPPKAEIVMGLFKIAGGVYPSSHESG